MSEAFVFICYRTAFQLKNYIVLGGVGLILLLTACQPSPLACDDLLGCVVVRPNNPIRIATLLPLSGETAVWGQELTRGIAQAVTDRGGELLNHTIELIPLDSACVPAVGQQAIQTVNNDETLLGVIGAACSDVAAAVLPTIRRNNWLLISPASTAPSLSEDQSELAFFRTVPNHLHQANVAAHFAYEQLGVRQTAVFHDETSYNSLLAQQFSDTFTRLGGSVSFQSSLTAGQVELPAMLADAASNRPELIYLAMFEPEANLLINRLAETAPLNRVPLLGGDTLFSLDFASRIGSSATIFLTSPVFNNDAYANFLEEWLIRYGMPPESPAPAYAYDATHLLLMAIEDVAVVGQNGTLVIGRAALRERLAASDGIIGLTGLLGCNSSGECASSAYGVYELDTAVRSSNIWPPPPIWQFE